MDYTDLEKKLNIQFKDPALLRQALTHSSFANENAGAEDNERLEFLGDAILSFIISEMLYKNLHQSNEGELTSLRARLVRGESLARIAREIDLGNYLLLGKGEEASGGREKASNLAAGFEALIASVYLDSGLDSARRMIKRLFGKEIGNPDISGDYKSGLQEITLARWQEVPTYRIVSSSGPEHRPVFKAEVLVHGNVLGQGEGTSKKAAEMAAARDASSRLYNSETYLLNSLEEGVMGGKDYRHRESKKPKKDVKKELAAEIIPLEKPEVEVIGKRKKKQEEVE